jgi:hypothetical protein
MVFVAPPTATRSLFPARATRTGSTGRESWVVIPNHAFALTRLALEPVKLFPSRTLVKDFHAPLFLFVEILAVWAFARVGNWGRKEEY